MRTVFLSYGFFKFILTSIAYRYKSPFVIKSQKVKNLVLSDIIQVIWDANNKKKKSFEYLWKMPKSNWTHNYITWGGGVSSEEYMS